MARTNFAVLHLMLRLRPLNRALRAAVSRRSTVAARLDRLDLTSLCVTNNHVAQLLDQADTFATSTGTSQRGQPAETSLNETEQQLEADYRLAAAERGEQLPLDHLGEATGLTEFEQEALLLCTATELHPAYERVYAFILDDLNRRFPCVELLCALTARSTVEELERRSLIGRYGRLRRSGLLETFGEITTAVRTQLRPGLGVVEFLTGAAPLASGLWSDPFDVASVQMEGGLAALPRKALDRIGDAIRMGHVNAAGLWGRSTDTVDDAAGLVSQTAGMPLLRLPSPADQRDQSDVVNDAVRMAAIHGAILQVPSDDLQPPEYARLVQTLSDCLSCCPLPVILTGTQPWRPPKLLGSRSYVECWLEDPDYDSRRAIWSHALPDLDGARVDGLAGRFHMSRLEVDAVARMARAEARLAGNGTPDLIERHVDDACAAVARGVSGRMLTLVKPRRGPEDLILSSELHDQVLDVARFTRVLPRVCEKWGFGRLASGGTGIKALFTGDPGTGKTLAAEVIAGELSVPLLKVNIGQVLSRWVGEGEKNIDEAFREATACHAALFFDEADALFGKRGEVSRGTDRYANTEVSHLLQRLEDHDGLVILASNLQENIDRAFLRRMQVVVHFPRPTESERRRIWNVAFPPDAPLAPCIDLDAVSRLDMTGASIVSAARTSALLAADAGEDVITMADLLRGIERQFRRESRAWSVAELGTYGEMVREA